MEKGGDAGRVTLHGLRETGGAHDEEKRPGDPSPCEEPPPRHAHEPGEDAERGQNPDRQAEEKIPVVGEPVAQRADPVRTRHRRGLQGGNRPPVVGQKGDEREERDGEQQPAERRPRLLPSCVSVGMWFCHGLKSRPVRRA